MDRDDSGSAPGSAFWDEYRGVDFGWFAADADGNVGIFFNDGFGFVPEAVQARYPAHAQLAEEIKQPYANSIPLAHELARLGLFVFAWSGQWEPYNWSLPTEPYEQLAQPAQPLDPALKAQILQIGQLPVLRQNFHSGARVSVEEFTPTGPQHPPAMQKTALLAGATGLIGAQLLPLLLASERYAKVIVVGRRAVPTIHPKLVQVTTELDQLEAVRLRLIADDVYCCLGTTMKQAGSKEAFFKVDFLYVVQLAAVSASNFASRLLVVSSMGADAESRIYYSRVKGEMEAAVRQAPFRAIHIFRPSLLLGARDRPRAGESVAAVLMRAAAPLLRGPLLKYRPVTGAAVAAAMLRAAEDGGGGVRVHESEEFAQA